MKIIEAELCPDHVHMLVEIPPKIAVSSFMGYLKGKSTTMIYEQFPELKYKYKQREFWCKGYYVDTVGKNEGRIAEYIKHQLDEDRLGEQLSIPEATKPRNKKKIRDEATQLSNRFTRCTCPARNKGYARQ